MDVQIQPNGQINEAAVIELYRANGWFSADKPDQLIPALRDSHTLVTARLAGVLVGVGNAISDGQLGVYYPHMLGHPGNHGKGIGRKMMEAMQSLYGGFHQQMLTADGGAIEFYWPNAMSRAIKARDQHCQFPGCARTHHLRFII